MMKDEYRTNPVMENQESSSLGMMVADMFVSGCILDHRLGGRRIRSLLASGHLKNLRDLYRMTAREIMGMAEEVFHDPEENHQIRMLLAETERRDQAEKDAAVYLRRGIRSVNRDDPDYPKSLLGPDGMPLILYGMGDFSLLGIKRPPVVAVVGSRRPSSYGIAATREITRDLAKQGVVIVSGLARGIDTVAHEETLRNQGRTVAVLAGGLDNVYPPENKDLFGEIASTGLVLSELSPTAVVTRKFFPARNRILSGLSDAVAIMEAGEFSGTLHTASFAAVQGRDVFVIPGGIYQSSYRGSLRLLQDGAELLICAEDILARLAGVAFYREIDEIRSHNDRKRRDKKRQEGSEPLGTEDVRQMILDELTICEKSIDELSQTIGVSFCEIAPVLSELELGGAIREDRQRFALTFARP